MVQLPILRGFSTISFVVLLMWFYKNFSLGAYVFLGVCGSYELIRMAISKAFDLSPKPKYLSAIYLPKDLFFPPMIPIWTMAYLMISDPNSHSIAPERILWACVISITGETLLMITETQKVIFAKHHKYLPTNGIFQLARNPEFFALFLVTVGIAILVKSTLCWVLLALVDLPVAYLALQRKERGLEKEEGWNTYKQRTWSVVPNVWNNSILSILCYTGLAFAAFTLHSKGGLVRTLTVKH